MTSIYCFLYHYFLLFVLFLLSTSHLLVVFYLQYEHRIDVGWFVLRGCFGNWPPGVLFPSYVLSLYLDDLDDVGGERLLLLLLALIAFVAAIVAVVAVAAFKAEGVAAAAVVVVFSVGVAMPAVVVGPAPTPVPAVVGATVVAVTTADTTFKQLLLKNS